MGFAMIITVIGFLLLLDKMEIISGEVWGYFWPILIVLIGVSMMYKRMLGEHHWCDFCSHGREKKSTTKTTKK